MLAEMESREKQYFAVSGANQKVSARTADHKSIDSTLIFAE
jgi:hypothetical protein